MTTTNTSAHQTIHQTILTVKNLSHRFGSDAIAPQLFNHLSFDIPNGVTMVIGDEQTGKTTLLRILAGDLQPKYGDLLLSKTELSSEAESYAQHVFWANPYSPRSPPQDNETPNSYFATVQRSYPQFDAALLAQMLQGLSLTEHLHKAMYMLSAGTKRKVWLAAAFASGAALTLLDEPFAALDLASINFVKKQLNNAALFSHRACVLADYVAPVDVQTSSIIHLE